MFLFVLLLVAVVVLVLVDSVVGTDSGADTDTVPKTSTPLSQRDSNTVSVDEIIDTSMNWLAGLPDIGKQQQIEKQKDIVGRLGLTVNCLLDALTESDVPSDKVITLDWLQSLTEKQ